jgi:hypothetical protein
MNAASNRFRSLAKGFRSRPHRPPGAYREWPKECRRGEIAACSINEHTLIPLVLLMAIVASSQKTARTSSSPPGRTMPQA